MTVRRGQYQPGVRKVMDSVVYRGSVLRHCEDQFRAMCDYASRLEAALQVIVNTADETPFATVGHVIEHGGSRARAALENKP